MTLITNKLNMKTTKIIAALLVSFATTAETMGQEKSTLEEKDMGAYLMVYHKDATHGLYMAISHDGREFTALNNDQPVIAGDTIAMQKGIRDPHIFRAPNGSFYLAMTDLHIFAQQKGYRETEWERDGAQFGWGNNRGLVLMKSDDLIHWKRANIRFDTMDASLSDIGCAWAPETAYDYAKQKLVIYFTMRHGNGMNKLYYCYVNDDYDTIETLPEELFEYPKEGVSAIDGDICYAQGKYHLFYCAHDGTPGIKQATSDNIYGPWDYDPAYCDYEEGACEAPHVFKIIGEDRWILMYDIYSVNPHDFGFVETTDFKTFTNLGHFDGGVMKSVNFQEQKHGAVCWLTTEEAERLELYWSEK